MTNSNYKIIQPNQYEHLRPIGQLAADVFSDGNYVDQFCENYIGNNHYDWETSRIIFDGETLIHHWGVWGYRMRVACLPEAESKGAFATQLKVAGIGAVATHADYRKQGLMHNAAQESFQAMQPAGYDLSILRGRHYVKMGYARAWNYVTTHVRLEELPKADLSKPYQALRADQVGEKDALYNETHAHFSGTAIRPTYLNRHADDICVYGWFDEQGKLEGYVRAQPSEEDPKTLQCLEAAGDALQGLAVLREIYTVGLYEKLVFFTLPHQHPMLQILRKGACIVEDRYFDVSGWRVRLVNLPSSLAKLTHILGQRLAQSQFAKWKGDLLLDSGLQTAILQIEHGKVQITSEGSSKNILHGGADIARLLIGSDDPDEIIRQAGMYTSALAVPLARVLFPNLHPMMSAWDEF
jgi:predicted acetyltransferase